MSAIIRSMLLDGLDEAFDKKSWHGPNLRGAIRGVTASQAAWRPTEDRHNIWELTLHAAYWKYAVRRKILREKRGSFVLPGSNFFERPENESAAAGTASPDLRPPMRREARYRDPGSGAPEVARYCGELAGARVHAGIVPSDPRRGGARSVSRGTDSVAAAHVLLDRG